MRKSLAIVVTALLVLGVMPVAVGAGAIGWDFAYTGQTTASGWPGGTLFQPHGVAVDKFGTTYVVGQSQDVVNVYDSNGVLVDTWGSTGDGDGELVEPRDVDVDRWGNVYVLERGNGRVSMFGGYWPGSAYNGTFYRHISESGFGVDQLNNPQGLAVSLDGNVYVTDNLDTLKYFTKWKDYVTSWSLDGPTLGIACDQDGWIWAANDWATTAHPDYANSIVKYSRWGVIMDSWGATGTAPGEFDRAYDVDVDPGGRVFALDSNGERVQAFTGDGGYLTEYTGAGATPSTFWWPYGLAAGPTREFRIADTANNRVVSFEATPAVPTGYTSIAGSNRYATAEAAVNIGWETAEYVIVATGDNWPDALSGAGLAGACGGPLLLTDSDHLSPQVESEIARLCCDHVYVLGGTGAVSSDVYDEIVALMPGPANVSRLGGANRFETSSIIASETVSMLAGHYDGTGIVVTGRNFPDALAVSPIAAANKWPILLTEPDDIPTVVADTMTTWGINHGYVIGGESAVNTIAFAELDALWIGTPYRIEGPNRYATAAAVAEIGYTGMGMMYSRPALATGDNFPDALAGGILQGSDYSVMLLTRSGSLHSATAAALTANRDRIYELRYLGGDAALSPDVRSDAAALLH